MGRVTVAEAESSSESLLERIGLPLLRLRPGDEGPVSHRHRSPTFGPEQGRHHVDPDLRAATADGAELLSNHGNVDAAHRVLVAAINSSQSGPEYDIPGLADALHTLSMVCHFGGRPELWAPFHRAVDLLDDAVPPMLRLITRMSAGPVAASAAFLSEIGDQVNLLWDGDPDPAQTVHLGMAACVVDRLGCCRDPLRRVFLAARDEGANGWAVRAGLLLAVEAVDAGRWAEAAALADECIVLCEASGQQLWAWSARYVLALVAALRGEWDICSALTNEMVEWATPRGVFQLVHDAHHARCLALLGLGANDDAFTLAASFIRHGATRTIDSSALRGGLDLVEAAVRTRRDAAAMAQASAMAASGIGRFSPRRALQAASAEALVAPDELAAGLFQAALDIPGIERWPFEVARVQLAFGERLRRRRATRASREQLAAALDTFNSLGARPWAERASAELLATGQTRHRPDGKSPALLTPQEIAIAELAATGLTNKQIGGKLYLSPRTVSAHLYRIFPKLGITSRAALRDALRSLPSALPAERPDFGGRCPS